MATRTAPPNKRLPARSRSRALHRTVSGLALLAGSIGLATLSTPALAQCVEGVPGEYLCSGDLQVGQIIVGDDISAATTAGFAVDTTANGAGLALQMTGDGKITYVDINASPLTGGGVRISSTGASGADNGSVNVFSDGAITANGAHGLRLDNAGGGDTTAVWTGGIVNTGGNGAFVRNQLGSGDLSLTFGEVNGRDDGVRIDFDGNGALTFVAQGALTGVTGSGLRIDGDAAGDDFDIQVGEVTGGAWGVVIDNRGTGSTRLVSTGTITGLGEAGVTIDSDVNTTDVEVDVADVDGQTSGIEIINLGSGDTTVRSNGMVAGGERGINISTGANAQSVTVEAVDAIGVAGGIVIEHEGSADVSVTATGVVGASSGTGIYIESGSTTTDISVQAASVSGGFVGIRTIHDGLGSTFVSATGPVVAGSHGVLAEAGTATTNMTIEVGDVTGGLAGIDVVNFGSGFTSIRSTGAVIGGGFDGIAVEVGTGSQGVSVDVVDVQGDQGGIVLENFGTGGSAVWATGEVSTAFGSGIEVTNGFGTTEIEIEATAVSGGDRGISASSEGLGGIYITATGPVTGDDFGIIAEIGAAGSNLLVDAVEVSSDGAGITAINHGDGFTRVISTGTVTGLGGAGVTVLADVNATAVDVVANQVSGATNGIQVVNGGTSATTVVATGTVTGAAAAGIAVLNTGDTTGLSITAADVLGAAGIVAENQGTGGVSVTATGVVTGASSAGIDVVGGLTSTDIAVQAASVSGAQVGIRTHNDGLGSTLVTASGPVTGGDFGVWAVSQGAGSDVTVEVADVTGGTGVHVTNFGSGDTTVLASGTVTGDGGRGIDIATGTGSQGVIVEAVEVFGAFTGINVAHEGSGAVSVTSTGDVTAGEFAGINVETGDGATDISVQAAGVLGGERGISTTNDGSGSTVIGASGPVEGWTIGVSAVNEAGSGALTIEVSDVTGGTGINVVNFGDGQTRVTSDGIVLGGADNGIAVQTGTASDGVSVEVSEVRGQANGIVIDNQGIGASVVAAAGDISAGVGSGIQITNGLSTTEIQIDVAGVAGGDRGIWATSQGDGGVYVNATGPVTGTDFGILAEIGANGANVQVDAVEVSSGGAGITAVNNGDGFTRVTSTGTVVGTGDAGISAVAGVNSFNVFIDVKNASGGISGVSAVSAGLGPVEITTRGIVEGGDQGIAAISDLSSVDIVNEGTVRNRSGLSSDRAIRADGGGGVSIVNNGLLVGELFVNTTASLTVNNGVWNSIGGTSLFTGADDGMLNAADGGIFGGGVAGLAETTTWSGLETFTNRGLLRFADGGTGDVIQTSANAVFEDTAVLAMDIGGAGLSDVFRTTGAVEIEAGSTLTVNRVQPLVLNSQYVVVDAAGGVTGEFDFEDELLTNFAGLRDGYTADTAFVEFVQLKALGDAALTPNQAETADGADSAPDGNPVKDALLLLPDDASAQDAFDQLSGEIHPSIRTAVVEDSRLPRGAVLDRLGYDEPERSAWGRAFGSSGRNDGDANAAEIDRETRGFVVGVDRMIGDRVTVGVAGGWLETDVDVGARNSNGTVESAHALAYAGARFGAWGVRGGVGYAATSADTRRRIAFPGFADVVTARYDGSVLQGFVEAGYRMPLGKGHIEPFVSLAALKVESDAFSEAGGPAALSVKAASEQTTISTVGLRFETGPLSGPLTLRGSTGWRHVSGDLDPVGVHAFDGGDPFTVLGAAQSGDAFLANVEARWRVSPAISFGVAYDGVIGSDGQDHAITGSFKVVF